MNILKKIMSLFGKNKKMLSDCKQSDEKIEKQNEKKEKFLETIRVNQDLKVKKKSGKIEAIRCEGDGTGICSFGG